MNTRLIRTPLTIAVLGALTIVAGCGGDGGASTASSPAPPDSIGDSIAEPADGSATSDTSSPTGSTPAGSTAAGDTTTSVTGAPSADAVGFPVTIEHALGTTEIPAQPERVVSASGTMTGHLLALGVPVVAAQVLPPQSPLSDRSGFLRQWGDVAASEGVEAIAGPEVNIEAVAAAQPDLIVGNSFGGDAVTEDVYGLLSQIAPTIVIDHSGMQWQELAVILGAATGRTGDAQAAIDAFDAHVAEVAATIDTTHPVVAGVITPEGVNVFTDESSHGRLIASLGLTLMSPEGGTLEGEQGAQTRSDVVSVSPELITDEFGAATVLFVFAEQESIDEALDLYPTLAATPAAEEGRLVALGVESFRIDAYSADLVVDRLADALSS